MSTRTNIVVKFGKTRVYLYRHCDGYPAETGASIVEALKHALHGGTQGYGYGCPNKFLHKLCAERYEATTFRPETAIYEFTNDLHGDIQWLYEINFNRDPSRMIRVAERPRSFPELEQWANEGSWVSLEAFIAQVNRDRTKTNARLAQLRASNPGTYADTDDYPMLNAA